MNNSTATAGSKETMKLSALISEFDGEKFNFKQNPSVTIPFGKEIQKIKKGQGPYAEIPLLNGAKPKKINNQRDNAGR